MSDVDKSSTARVSWLQSIVSHRIVPAPFAKHLYKRCCTILDLQYTEAAYRTMFDEAAKHLSVLDLELRNFRDQQTGQTMLALVNTKDDALVQGATRYSSNEIAFVKKLIEEIFKARREAYAIPSLEAVRLGSKLRTHLTRDATEELLKNLVDHNWIDYSSDGIYTLSTRALLELRNYLQNEFGDEHFHTCSHCKDIVTLGVGCSYTSRGCTTRYHLHCARNTIGSAVDDDDALHRLAGGFSCSDCGRVWKSRPIGPRALRLSTADHDGFFSSQGEASQTESPQRGARRHASEQDDDEDEEEEEEQDVKQQQMTSAATPQDDEEQDEDDEPTPRRSTRVKPEPDHQQTPLAQPSRRRTHNEDGDEGDASDEELDIKPRKRAH